MGTITLKGAATHTVGTLPKTGGAAPDFTLTTTNLNDVSLHDYKGKNLVLNIFPSLDTATCAMSVRAFNMRVAKLPNTVVLCISMDLPFAMKRFCENEGLNHVISLSGFRHPGFGAVYGLTIADGPLKGLFSRAVIVINDSGKVTYTEQIAEIADEPQYDKALAVIKETVPV